MTEQRLRAPTRLSPRERRRRHRARQRRTAFAALAVAAAAGIVVWLVILPAGANHPRATIVSPIAPVALSASGLRTLAGAVGQPIYWAGPARGHRYELTRTSAGNVYIRYLPRGVEAGATGAKYLVVTTYPQRGAFAALRAAGGKELSVAGSRGIAVVEPNRATNVRVAFPGVDYEIEVYDPSPRVARAIATSRALGPVAEP